MKHTGDEPVSQAHAQDDFKVLLRATCWPTWGMSSLPATALQKLHMITSQHTFSPQALGVSTMEAKCLRHCMEPGGQKEKRLPLVEGRQLSRGPIPLSPQVVHALLSMVSLQGSRANGSVHCER